MAPNNGFLSTKEKKGRCSGIQHKNIRGKEEGTAGEG